MRDWKTTACGIAGALAAFVVGAPEHFSPLVQDVARFVLAGGLLGLGITAAQVKGKKR